MNGIRYVARYETIQALLWLAAKFHIRWMDAMMKILLPACFIALKLTGTFIDFMLGLANSNVQEDTQITTAKGRDSRLHQIEIIFCCPTFIVKPWTEVLEIFDLYENSSAADSYISTGANKLKSLLSSKTVESFEFRTCVKPKLSKNQFGETEIIYESLTAKDLLWNQNFFNFLWVGEFFFFEAWKVCQFRWRPAMRKYNWENLSWSTRYGFCFGNFFIFPFESFQSWITKSFRSKGWIHF